MAHRGPIHLGASCRGAVMVLHHPVHPLSSSLHLMLHLLLTGRGRRLLVRFLGFTLEELLTERERLLHLLAVVVVHVVLVLRHTATLHLPVALHPFSQSLDGRLVLSRGSRSGWERFLVTLWQHITHRRHPPQPSNPLLTGSLPTIN